MLCRSPTFSCKASALENPPYSRTQYMTPTIARWRTPPDPQTGPAAARACQGTLRWFSSTTPNRIVPKSLRIRFSQVLTTSSLCSTCSLPHDYEHRCRRQCDKRDNHDRTNQRAHTTHGRPRWACRLHLDRSALGWHEFRSVPSHYGVCPA